MVSWLNGPKPVVYNRPATSLLTTSSNSAQENSVVQPLVLLLFFIFSIHLQFPRYFFGILGVLCFSGLRVFLLCSWDSLLHLPAWSLEFAFDAFFDALVFFLIRRAIPFSIYGQSGPDRAMTHLRDAAKTRHLEGPRRYVI